MKRMKVGQQRTRKVVIDERYSLECVTTRLGHRNLDAYEVEFTLRDAENPWDDNFTALVYSDRRGFGRRFNRFVKDTRRWVSGEYTGENFDN